MDSFVRSRYYYDDESDVHDNSAVKPLIEESDLDWDEPNDLLPWEIDELEAFCCVEVDNIDGVAPASYSNGFVHYLYVQ